MTTPDPLNPLLASWRVEPRRDSHFRASVLEAIGQEASQNFGSYLRHHAALTAGTAAMVVFAAGWVGHVQGQKQTLRDRDLLAQAYLGSIDARLRPEGMTHSH